MAESVENRRRNVSDSTEKKAIGRILLDAIAESILKTVLFVFGFLGWCVRWSFATIFFVVVMGLAAWFVFNEAVKGGGFVVVPDVTGLPVTQASNLLAEAGLEVGKQDSVMNDSVPEYHVLVQRPTAGEVIRTGRSISLTISAGNRAEPVPDLVGKDIETALDELGRTRFMSGPIARMPSDQPRGVILAQDPRPGKPTSVGSDIGVLVSDGPAAGPVRAPNLVGLPISEAVDELASQGIAVEPVSVNKQGADYDMVLAQTPEPGTMLFEDQSVAIEFRPLQATALPNIKQKVDVVYTVPATSFSPEIRVDVIDHEGNRNTVFPKSQHFVDGLAPRLQPGTRITIPEVRFEKEATVQFFADGVLHKSYYYRGLEDPVIRTINEPDAGAGAVASQPLQPSPDANRRGIETPPQAPPPANNETEIEVFEPRVERVGPPPQN